ncbi:MAG: two-component regulator propeller domain-containing protein [Bacteroidota bacterium]
MLILRKLIKYYLIYLFLINLNVYAQEYTYHHYGVEDGLPSSEVYQVFQDSKGYLWFATDMGVSRFNGYEFINFDIKNGLTNNTVFEIFEDHHGKIWFLSLSNKLSYFYKDTIVQYKYNRIIEKHTKNSKLSIKRTFHIDSLDNIYFSVIDKGIFKLSPQGQYSNLQKNDTDGTLRIIKTANKLIPGYNIIENFIKIIAHNNNTINTKSEGMIFGVSPLYFTEYDSKKEGVLITYSSYIFNIKSNKITKVKTFEKEIIWFSKDQYNRYWVSLRNGGVYRFDNDEFISKNSKFFLKNKDVSSILIDKEKGYWFSTLNDGVYFLPSFELNHIPETKNKNVLNIAQSNEKLLISLYEAELMIFNNNYHYDRNIFLGTLKSANKIIFDQRLNLFWIGTYQFVKQFKNNKLTEIHKNSWYNDNKKLGEVSIKSMALDQLSGIWLGTYTGIYHVVNNKIIYKSFKDDNWKEMVYSIISNPDGSLWLGTFSGLWKYKNGEYIYYGKQNKLLKHRINTLLKYKNNLYIGTKGAGLIIYNLENKSIQLIHKNDGLTSNSITSITKHKETLWIGTNRGVNILNVKVDGNYSIKQFDSGNGLLSNEITQLYVYDSTMYIAGKKGVNYLNLNKFNDKNSLLNTYIEKVIIGNNDTVVQKNYELNHEQNFINVSYKAISFKSGSNILYRYKMYPMVTDWTYTKKDELQFTSLNPGNYKFVVSAKNQSGEWNDIGTKLNFIIEAPFWQTWWFIASVITLFIFLVLAIINFKLQQVKKENRLKKELNLYMKKAINSQINPHFVFNSLNSINQYILKSDKINSSKYLNRFSIYIRSILNALKNDYQSLSEELKISELYLELEKFRLKDKLSYNIKIDKSVKSLNIQIPSLVITPFLENSIWLGILPKKGLGKIDVLVFQENKILTMSISDNGIGRTESLKLQNNPDFSIKTPGPENTLERIKLLNDLYSDKIEILYTDIDESEDKQGTVVEIKVKICPL